MADLLSARLRVIVELESFTPTGAGQRQVRETFLSHLRCAAFPLTREGGHHLLLRPALWHLSSGRLLAAWNGLVWTLPEGHLAPGDGCVGDAVARLSGELLGGRASGTGDIVGLRMRPALCSGGYAHHMEVRVLVPVDVAVDPSDGFRWVHGELVDTHAPALADPLSASSAAV